MKRSHHGETVVSEKLTLGQYLTERWLPVQEARLRKSTHDAYRRNIELHVIPALGKRQLDQLTPEDIDLLYAALLRSGRKKHPGEKGPTKGLAPKAVHNIHVMLNKALGDAARKGTVVGNVVALADTPSLRARKRPEIKAWEIGQLVQFLDAIAPHRIAPALPPGPDPLDRGLVNTRRLHSRIDYRPPVEFEDLYYRCGDGIAA